MSAFSEIKEWINPLEFNEDREVFLEHYFLKYEPETAKIIKENNGDFAFSKALFNIGELIGYYTGRFDENEFPKRPNSTNRLVDAAGVDSKYLGYIHFDYGFQLKGPFIWEKNMFNKPWMIRSWDIKIEHSNGHYIRFDPVRTMKALLLNYDDMLSDRLCFSFNTGKLQQLYKGMNKKSDRYSDHFSFRFKNAEFTGETLTADVESASNNVTNEYGVTYQNCAFETIKGLVFKDNLSMSCGCGDKIKGSDTKDEHTEHDLPGKHLLALMIYAKYFPEKIRIEKPKGVLATLENLCTGLDLMESFKRPDGKENRIAKGINSLLAWRIYAEKKPMYDAEFELFNNIGFEYMMSPFLQANGIIGIRKSIFEDTAILTGNVDNISAVLLQEGSKRLGRDAKYYVSPKILTKNVKAPLFSSDIKTIDFDGGVFKEEVSKLSISPSRQKYTIKFYKKEEDDIAFDPRSSHFYLKQKKQGISPDWNALTDKGVYVFDPSTAAFLRSKVKLEKS
ncbi:MAG: hypothetical protein JW791_02420 [Nanoarchaeota archaeon]|nr:hypothetical protein [Nanoarchaeota archaeon]